MILEKARLIPRYNWDYGLKELVTALGSLLGIVSGKKKIWEEVFGRKPVLTTSGRTSLYTILKALELPEGAGVGVPLYCCPVVFDAIRQSGLVPVFLDINIEDYNVSAKDILKKREKLSAVVVVHMFGQPADMDSLSEVCVGVPVIEDCAQALFSEYKGKQLGFSSTASFFSFRSGKYISAGEGSAIFCQEKALCDTIRLLVDRYDNWRWYQQVAHVVSTYIKSKFYRPPLYGTLGYPIGRVLDKKLNLTAKSGFKLRKISSVDQVIIENRMAGFIKNVCKQKNNGKYLKDKLNLIGSVGPLDLEGRRSNCYQFPIRFKDERRRDLVADYLFKKGIDCAKYLDDIVPTAKELYGYEGDCPVSEQCSKTILSIPIHYMMARKDLDRIAHAWAEVDTIVKTCKRQI